LSNEKEVEVDWTYLEEITKPAHRWTVRAPVDQCDAFDTVIDNNNSNYDATIVTVTVKTRQATSA